MASVRLVYVGRMAFVSPRAAGQQFRDSMEVEWRETEAASKENGWQAQQRTHRDRLHWNDVDALTGEEVMCFFSGYGPRVHQALTAQGHTVSVEDRRPCGLHAPDFQAIRGTTFRGRQAEGMANMLASRGGLVLASTGYGKSFTVRTLARLFPLDIGIVTAPSTTNARDLYNALKDSIPDLGFVGDGHNKPDRVTVAVTHSLHHCDQNASWCLVDEAHMACAAIHVQKLIKLQRAKMFALTASGKRPDGRDGYLEAIFGPTLLDVEYGEAVASGNVVQIRVTLLPIRKGPDVDGMTDKTAKDKMALWRNLHRNQTIADATLERIARHPEAQVLVMVDKTEHAFRLGQLLPGFTVVHGDLPKDRLKQLISLKAFDPKTQIVCDKKALRTHQLAFTEGRLRHVIATGIWSRGVDFKDLNLLVRADGLGSIIAADQIPGRLSRLGSDGQKPYGEMLDCVDFFSRCMLGRALTRLSIYGKNEFELDPASVALKKEASSIYRNRGKRLAGLPSDEEPIE